VRTNPLAETVFQALASRDRPRATTDLGRFRRSIIEEEGIAIDNREFLSIFKKLQEAGFGTLINPNPRISGDPHRFKWKYNLIEVGQRALGSEKQKAAAPVMATQPTSDSLRIPFPIRDGVLYIDLPRDVTKKETAELADFIRRFGK
jgi:hypothetical protein